MDDVLEINALTEDEVKIVRLIIAPEKADYMEALSNDKDFARAEIAKFQQNCLSELAVDLQVNADQKENIEAEIQLLS